MNVNPATNNMLQQLGANNFRHEVLIMALIEILLEQKDAEGNPIYTREALDAKALEIQKKFEEANKIAKPTSNIILPR